MASTRLPVLLCVLVLWCVRADDVILTSNSTNVVVSEQDFKNTPIVIQTQARDYDQPNLDEYNKCNENRDVCLNVCASHTDREKCEEQCLQCPILISHDIAVQGVNDTLLRQPVENTSNITNVIKLTNNIHTVVENKHNITANNENNVVVHQNISTVGGKYGFGYSNKGPCCMVVRPSSSCSDAVNSQSNSRSRRSACPEKRHRLCSEKRCKAAVMRAKPIHHCTVDEDGNENCDKNITFEYIPYQSAQQPKCKYTPHWPYVQCANQQRNLRSNLCRRCAQISYGEVLQNGVPFACQHCFTAPTYNMLSSPSLYSPYYNFAPQIYNYENDYMPTPDASWRVEKLKCRFPDGTITDCGPGVSVVDDSDINTANSFVDNDEKMPFINDKWDSNLPDDINSEYATSNDYIDENEDSLRRRRQISRLFKRSKYSKRYQEA